LEVSDGTMTSVGPLTSVVGESPNMVSPKKYSAMATEQTQRMHITTTAMTTGIPTLAFFIFTSTQYQNAITQQIRNTSRRYTHAIIA
jgi:hypothetical protein